MAGKIYKSKNINQKFIKAGRIVAGKIASIDGVVGVIATGGIGRGFSDYLSDLDFFVFADKSKAKAISK